MKKTKEWQVSKCTDMTVYNARLAKKLRKMAMKLIRVAKHYGVNYIDLAALGDYASARAREEHGATATTVVDDYMFTIKED